MNMRRKTIVLAVGVALSAPLIMGFGLKLPGLGGGGGGSWTGIVKDWKDGLSQLSSQIIVMTDAQADLAEALGLKREAAQLRSSAKKLKEQGDELGGAAIKEAGKISSEAGIRISERLSKAQGLNAGEKAAIAKAGAKYTPAVVKSGVAGFKLFQASQSAASAGPPSPTDIAALPIAVKIPALIPAVIEIVPKIFETANKFREVAAEKDIAVPDTGDMPPMT